MSFAMLRLLRRRRSWLCRRRSWRFRWTWFGRSRFGAHGGGPHRHARVVARFEQTKTFLVSADMVRAIARHAAPLPRQLPSHQSHLTPHVLLVFSSPPSLI